MAYVSEADLIAIVPDLRAMARIEPSADVRAALHRLANRYARMADEGQNPERVAPTYKVAA